MIKCRVQNSNCGNIDGSDRGTDKMLMRPSHESDKIVTFNSNCVKTMNEAQKNTMCKTIGVSLIKFHPCPSTVNDMISFSSGLPRHSWGPVT